MDNSDLSNGSMSSVDSLHCASRHSSRTSSSSGVALAGSRKRRLFPTVAALSIIHACCLGVAYAQEVQQKQAQPNQPNDGSDGDQDAEESKSLADVDQQMIANESASPETKESLESSPTAATAATVDAAGTASTSVPTLAPTVVNFDVAEEEHSSDAYTALALNFTLIVCVMMAYYVKKHKIYYLPESAAAMLVGVVIGGIARLFLTDLTLWTFVSRISTGNWLIY